MGSDALARVKMLIAEGKVRVSDRGHDELVDDDILVTDVVDGVQSAILVEDYPEFRKGPSVLVLQHDAAGRPMHVVWGIPKGRTEPAVVAGAYRPDLTRWSSDFMKRKI